MCKEQKEQKSQILVPPRLREVVMHLAHLPPQAAHPGARRIQDFEGVLLGHPQVGLCEVFFQLLSFKVAKGPGAQRTHPLQLFPPLYFWDFV
jgi:hypothetical protein